MTQAYNLAILANAVDSSGKLNVATNSTGVLPQANGGTGSTALSSVAVTSLTAGSGISVSASTGSVTISASGGGVTSLNGQTGAITNTNYGSIGSYSPGTIASTNNASYNPDSTIAGSSLRRRTTVSGGDNWFSAFDAFQPASAANPGFTGTWRAMGYSKNQSPGYTDSCGANLWVRIS